MQNHQQKQLGEQHIRKQQQNTFSKQHSAMSSESLQAKQNYLHFQILQKEYDPEQFQQFMSNKKGLNLDDYSMKELVQFVSEFKTITDGIENQGFIEINNTNFNPINQHSLQDENSNVDQNNNFIQETKVDQEQKAEKQQAALSNEKSKQKIDLLSQNQQKSETTTNQTTKKISIDLKKMIIPQYKPQQNSIQKTQQNKKTQQVQKSVQKFDKKPKLQKDHPLKTANQNFNQQVLIEKIANKQTKEQERQPTKKNEIKDPLKNTKQISHSLEKHRNSSKVYYQEDQDDQKEPTFEKAFIKQNGLMEQNKLSDKKIGSHRYNENATESFYIPSSNTKLPFVITNKSITSSLFKEIKSFTRIDKDGKERNEFFDGFKIKVNSFSKKQSTSIFRFPFITYHVQTIFNNQKEGNQRHTKDQSQLKNRTWKVERRFNDFKWLHDYVQNSYFGTPIPPIPAKTKMRSFDDTHLEQRMIVFERFLNKCVHIDEIASDPVFEAFLSIQSSEQLEGIKRKYGNKLKSRDQNIMQFLRGDEILNFSKGITSISHSTKSFFVKSSELLSSLNQELIRLQQSLKLASQSAVSASNTLRELGQLYKSNHEYEIRGAAMFDVVSEYVGELSSKLNNETYSLKKFVGNCWMYEEMYQKNILSYINSLEKHKNIMDTKFKDIQIGKNSQMGTQQPRQSFASTTSPSGSSSNFKTMELYKKTRQLYEINLSLLIQQISRHLEQDLLTLSRQFSQGLNQYVGRLKDQMIVGVDLITKVITVAEGKQLKEVDLISKNMNKNKNSQKTQFNQ